MADNINKTPTRSSAADKPATRPRPAAARTTGGERLEDKYLDKLSGDGPKKTGAELLKEKQFTQTAARPRPVADNAARPAPSRRPVDAGGRVLNDKTVDAHGKSFGELSTDNKNSNQKMTVIIMLIIALTVILVYDVVAIAFNLLNDGQGTFTSLNSYMSWENNDKELKSISIDSGFSNTNNRVTIAYDGACISRSVSETMEVKILVSASINGVSLDVEEDIVLYGQDPTFTQDGAYYKYTWEADGPNYLTFFLSFQVNNNINVDNSNFEIEFKIFP